MEQTFLQYVLTDARFSLASGVAIWRGLFLPMIFLSGGFAAIGVGTAGFLAMVLAGIVCSAFDWVSLVVRMARRIALGEENPTRMASLPVAAMSQYLRKAYF